MPFAFCRFPYPLTHQCYLRFTFPVGWIIGLTLFLWDNIAGLGSVKTPGMLLSVQSETSSRLSHALPFGLSLSTLFGSLGPTDAFQQFTCVNHTSKPCPIQNKVFWFFCSSRILLRQLIAVRYFVPRALHPKITLHAHRSRLLPTER